MKMVKIFFENSQEVSQKIKRSVTQQIPFQGMNPRELNAYVHTKLVNHCSWQQYPYDQKVETTETSIINQ